MPELPEVESLRRLLEARLVGAQIQSAAIIAPQILKRPDPETFAAQTRGLFITGTARRGKYLLLKLARSRSQPEPDYELITHLKMQGWLRVEPADAAPDKYLCAELTLNDNRALRFYDMWRWGEWSLLPAGTAGAHIPGLAKMGLEPLGPDFTFPRLQAQLSKRRGPLKPVLLDQEVVAGLGSIYCDESLHRAGLHPTRAASGLRAEEAARLHAAIVAVLNAAVDSGGARVEALAARSANLDDLSEVYAPQIYDRPGQPCPTCHSSLVKIQLRGRGATFCPICQPDADNAPVQENGTGSRAERSGLHHV